MTKIIELVISPSGETKLKTKGFTGGECQQASRFLEEALGVKAGERLTAEFYQSQSTGARLQEGQS